MNDDNAIDVASPPTASSRTPAGPSAGSAPKELFPYRDALTLPPVYDLTEEPDEVARTVNIRSADHNYAPSQLAGTTSWTYDGSVPGPTFVVRRGQAVRVRFHNGIDKTCTLPYRVVRFQDADPTKGEVPPQNFPGMDGGTVDPDGDALAVAASKLTAATVVHLHGGRSAADSDGWTENTAVSGRSQDNTYHDRPRSATLWYHDHALGVTRLNVYAGLFGFWLIRDEIEAGLIRDGKLPGGKDELPLVIQDRNLDQDAQGNLDGRILHKTETSTAEMFGPYTVVNGRIWPSCDVNAGPVRLRLLNGSNARTYCLRLVRAKLTFDGDGRVNGTTYDDDLADTVPIWQVGTDGGLLDAVVKPTSLGTVPDTKTQVDRGLLVAPAERADVVVDFSALKQGETLAFVNTAFAPFHGSTVTFPFTFNQDGTLFQEPNTPTEDQTAGQTDENVRLRFAHVLLFNVKARDAGRPGGDKPSPLKEGTALDPNFVRYVHQASKAATRKELVIPDGHGHRWIALSEFPAGKLFFRELEELTPQFGTPSAFPPDLPVISIKDTDGTQRWFRTAAMAFHDAVRIQVPFDTWEVWNFVNLTVDTHPIHVHLVEFQVLERIPVDTTVYVAETGATKPGQPIDLSPPSDPAKALPKHDLDPNEQGFKDTVRVNPGEVVKIAAHFNTLCGRYMYHCHILEHEDMDMMRPFVVVNDTALAVMGQMGMGGTGMGGMSM